MMAIIDMTDLRFLRTAARRWAVEHPENPNAKRVMRIVQDTHPDDNWIPTLEEKESSRMTLAELRAEREELRRSQSANGAEGVKP